jgi:hypothetical protein
MKIEDIHPSKNVRAVIIGIGILIIVLGILKMGISIGERRANFTGQFGDNFERNFVGPHGYMMMGNGNFGGGMMVNGNGAVGEIIGLNLPQLVVSGPDNLEKMVLISSSTTIRQFQENITSAELKIGDFVVVLGNPNTNGQVEAKLIRVMPSPNTSSSVPANKNNVQSQ